jgi:flagellar FliL protein
VETNIISESNATTVTEQETETDRSPYSFFTSVGTIKTKTKDVIPYSVVADVVIGYDKNDNVALVELNEKLDELKIFFSDFFRNKAHYELSPQSEEEFKSEIVELINTKVLSTSNVKIILFTQFDVIYEGEFN